MKEGKLLKLSVPQLPCMENEAVNNYVTGAFKNGVSGLDKRAYSGSSSKDYI